MEGSSLRSSYADDTGPRCAISVERDMRIGSDTFMPYHSGTVGSLVEFALLG